MDIRKIKKLIEMLEESTFDELEIKEGEESIRIARNRPIATNQTTYCAPAAPAPVAPDHQAAQALRFPDQSRQRSRCRQDGGTGSQMSIYPRSHKVNWNRDYFGPMYIPKAGPTIPMNDENFAIYEISGRFAAIRFHHPRHSPNFTINTVGCR